MISDYLQQIKALILGNPYVLHLEIVREEIFEDRGFYRFRLHLSDNSLMEMFEYAVAQENSTQIQKYSFHWQDEHGQLRARWDNAAHHPEIATHPYHVHKGDEENVTNSEPMTAEKVLSAITERLAQR